MRWLAIITVLLSASIAHASESQYTIASDQRKISVDLELVLAVDVSSSMDEDEQRLQRDGYVAALRHPAILAAIESGGIGRIAITYVEWGSIRKVTTVLDWTMLASRQDALTAAETLAGRPIGRAPSTSISQALSVALQMIEENNYDGARKVIDISGDGPNNVGPAVLEARARVLASGIEINGLPILIKKGRGGFQIDDLDLYYRECVIGGPSAFVIPVYSKKRLASTILQKLVLEMADLVPPHPPIHKVASRMDCMIGEKQRDEFMRSLGFE